MRVVTILELPETNKAGRQGSDLTLEKGNGQIVPSLHVGTSAVRCVKNQAGHRNVAMHTGAGHNSIKHCEVAPQTKILTT